MLRLAPAQDGGGAGEPREPLTTIEEARERAPPRHRPPLPSPPPPHRTAPAPAPGRARPPHPAPAGPSSMVRGRRRLFSGCRHGREAGAPAEVARGSRARRLPLAAARLREYEPGTCPARPRGPGPCGPASFPRCLRPRPGPGSFPPPSVLSRPAPPRRSPALVNAAADAGSSRERQQPRYLPGSASQAGATPGPGAPLSCKSNPPFLLVIG